MAIQSSLHLDELPDVEEKELEPQQPANPSPPPPPPPRNDQGGGEKGDSSGGEKNQQNQEQKQEKQPPKKEEPKKEDEKISGDQSKTEWTKEDIVKRLEIEIKKLNENGLTWAKDTRLLSSFNLAWSLNDVKSLIEKYKEIVQKEQTPPPQP